MKILYKFQDYNIWPIIEKYNTKRGVKYKHMSVHIKKVLFNLALAKGVKES